LEVTENLNKYNEEKPSCFYPKELQNTPSNDNITIDISNLNSEKQTLKSGQVIGRRYRIIRLIGKGGMGIVYQAFDLTLQIDIAIKLIIPDYFTDSAMINKFKNEILLTRSISHPNIIQIYNFEQIDKLIFITMQYIEGSNLKEIIKKNGPLDLTEITKYSIQILEGLKAAHSLNIIHNDLKPQNIIIDKNSNIYIADFGLSTLFKKNEINQVDKNFIGTPSYISPEQWTRGQYDFKSDLYSFGIMLFEMSTGATPFQADTVFEIVNKHLNDKVVFPEKCKENLPLFLKKIVYDCLKKDPKERAIKITDIISSFQSGTLIDSRRHKQRRKTLVKIFFTLISIILFYFIFFHLPGLLKPFSVNPSRNNIAILPFSKNTGNLENNQWGRVISSMLVTDLSLSRYLNVKHYEKPAQIKNRKLDYLISGNYSLDNEQKFKVNLNIIDPYNKSLLFTISESGFTEESIFFIIDSLSPRIKKILKLSQKELNNDIDEKIKNITSSNPQALLYYYSGEKSFNEGKEKIALNQLENALKLDTKFASAHFLLGKIYNRINDFYQSKKHMNLAEEYSRRLPVRERLKIRAYYQYLNLQNLDEAIKVYRKLLSIYPDDTDSLIILGGFYRLNEEWEEASKIFERIKPHDSFLAIYNIYYILFIQKKYDQTIKYLNLNRNYFENQAQFFRFKTYSYIMQGNLKIALNEINLSLKYNPYDVESLYLQGQIYYFMNKFSEAQKLFNHILQHTEDSPRRIPDAYMMLASLKVVQGHSDQYSNALFRLIDYLKKNKLIFKKISAINFFAYHIITDHKYQEAIKILKGNLQEALNINSIYHQRYVYFYLSIAYIEAKDFKSAEITMNKLKMLIGNKFNEKKLRHYYLLKGKINLAKYRIKAALRDFHTALNLLTTGPGSLDSILFFEPLADYYYYSGQKERALEYYKRICDLKFGRILFPSSYLKAFQRISDL
jgi:serine/threonine protein kinase